MEKIRQIIANSKFLTQFFSGLYFFWDKIIGPPRRLLFGWIGKFYRWYKKTWVRYTHDKYGGFVYQRGGIMVTLTILALFLIPTAINLTFNTVMFFTTYRSERVYLFNSSEIYPDDNIWSVRGCELVNCADESLYFRVAPTLFNQIWSVVYRRELFLPDDIASGVPPGKTECHIISYGIRVKSLMKRYEIYPDALYIACDGERIYDK